MRDGKIVDEVPNPEDLAAAAIEILKTLDRTKLKLKNRALKSLQLFHASYPIAGDKVAKGFALGSEKTAQLLSLVELVERLEFHNWAQEVHSSDRLSEKPLEDLDLAIFDRQYPKSTTGIATHTDYHEAQKSGLLELHERHTLLQCWIDGKAPLRIASTTMQPLPIPEDTFLETYQFPTEGRPPVILCILVNSSSRSLVGFGHASDTKPLTAQEKAFREALMVYHLERNDPQKKSRLLEYLADAPDGEFKTARPSDLSTLIDYYSPKTNPLNSLGLKKLQTVRVTSEISLPFGIEHSHSFFSEKVRTGLRHCPYY